MWITRDMADRLKEDKNYYIQVVIGPRQCGKSSLLAYLSGDTFKEVTLDDLQLRRLADDDPGLFLQQYSPPVLIDEVQYAPNLFPELKRIVDDLKRQALFSRDENRQTLIRLTGSNQILMDKNVKESLVGRASYFYLNTLTVNEIQNTFPKIKIQDILFHGGWPELYTNKTLDVVSYLNNYIRTYIEKDIVMSAGIVKQKEFNVVLGLLAARTGNLLDYSNVAKDSGVNSATIKDWVSVLERTDLIYLLQPYTNNLNKRLIKSPKFYFLDTGLAARLQGWAEQEPLLRSPQAGSLFETLVLAEIVKCKRNFTKDWKLFFWRIKGGEEVDFIIEKSNGEIIVIDAKLGIHNVAPEKLPLAFKKMLPQAKELIIVSIGGKRQYLAKDCLQLPIVELADYLV